MRPISLLLLGLNRTGLRKNGLFSTHDYRISDDLAEMEKWARGNKKV